MPIGKHILESLLKEKHPTIKYIFVTDDIFLADSLLGEEDLSVVYITRGPDDNYFTKEEFAEYLHTKGFVCARDYFYLPVFKSAASGRYIASCFTSNYITYSENVWKIFSGKGRSIDYYKVHPECLIPTFREYINTLDDPDAAVTDDTEDDSEMNKIYEGTGYSSINGRLCRFKAEDMIMIADFIPIPRGQIYRDDGIVRQTYFKIGAYKDGVYLPDITVSAKEFPSMSWIKSNWGFSANIAPNNSAKSHLEYAISAAGHKCAERSTVYTHTGWRKIDSEWAFLHGRGAIGAENVRVELDAGLEQYYLPDPVESYAESFKCELAFLDVSVFRVTAPLIAFTYLTPLNEFMRKAGCEPNFILYMYGVSGAHKSTLAALTLSHFGKFTYDTLPSNFRDTLNALEKKGSDLKDVLTIIDDYHPASGKNEVLRLKDTAQQVTRAYGDRGGRARLNTDLKLQRAYIPRGNLIITGEDIPDITESGIARHFLLEIKQGETNRRLLSELQANSEDLSLSMRGYIEWLRTEADSLPVSLGRQFEIFRNESIESSRHARLASDVAMLRIGFNYFVDYGISLGVLNIEDATIKKNTACRLFMELADEQNQRVCAEKPSEKFVNALRELLATRQCMVQALKPAPCEPSSRQQGFIGYEDDSFYYLYAGMTYKYIYEFYSQQGINFPVTEKTLWKRLEMDGLILTDERGGRIYRTKQKKISGTNNAYLWLYKTAITKNDEADNNSPQRDQPILMK